MPELGLQIRTGVHTGEVEVRGSDFGGMAVHIASRIAGLAGPGEVLVSSTVRDLLIGSDVAFDDRGIHQLKGVAGDWHVYGASTEVAEPV
jgi:class 3 adenylate cyclase